MRFIRRRWYFGRNRFILSRRTGRLFFKGKTGIRLSHAMSTVLETPYFYLFICIVAVWLLGLAYAKECRDARDDETSQAEQSMNTDQPDWQQVWQEMNKTYIIDDQYGQSGNVKETIIQEVDGFQADKEVLSANLIDPGIEILPKMQLCIENLGFTMEQLCDFDYLYNRFYTLNSGTSVTAGMLDVRTLLSKDLSIKGDNSKPQILIYHTHSQEGYCDSRPGVEEDTIVGVGNYLTEILTEQYGFNVIHHTGVYDMTDGRLDRDMAYERACPEIEAILADNPSIEVVIDLHRDGVREDVHLLTEIDGKQTAKIMFFNGVCRDENGDLKDLENPYREDNLAFSLQMRLASMLISNDFCRTNYLKTWRYNQHFLGRCILIEVGAQTNTLEEAMNACEPLARTLQYVLASDNT